MICSLCFHDSRAISDVDTIDDSREDAREQLEVPLS